jgi:two-component system, OmpR family, sensor histidine kinase MtrB
LWRRSLQLRVVTTTTVLTMVVIAILGNVLLARVRDGLLDDKVRAALIEAASGTSTAGQAFTDADRSSADYDTLVHDLVSRLSSAGGPAGANDVALLPGPGITAVGAPLGVTSRDMDDTSTIPAQLIAQVQATNVQQWTYCRFHSTSGSSEPAVAIGSPVNVPTYGTYELYFVFPLDKENATLGLVRRALLLAALGLVLLVGAIAWLVTRQVVTPVRMAARIAERLSAGRLEERMRVRGEDDLARLAASFNRMAISLQRQIRQLEDLSRVQRRFVSDVSHELRTPLTTVRMAADVLYEARQEFDPVVNRSAEILQAQLDRFEALLADLLEISRYDAGAAVLEAEHTDLRMVVEAVVEGMEQLAEHKGSTLVVRAASAPAIAEVDSRRIERILRNLLANAIEHGESRPIEVYVESDAEAVAIAVRDHGIGLAPGEAAMVFNRFWRADPARARTTGGTGLGLSISMEDAHLHGGWLQVWGEIGDGSQFRLTVPRELGRELEHSPIPLEPMDSARRRRPVAVGDPYQRVALEPTRDGTRAG